MRRARWICALTLVAIAGTMLYPGSAGAGGGGCYPNASGKITTARVTSDAGPAEIETCSFKPTVLYVDQGGEVTWVNKDPFPHTVTGAHVSWGSERYLSQGDSISQEFTKEGVFPYYCLLHPGMVGAVVVGQPDPDLIENEVSSMGNAGVVGSDSGPAAADAAAPPVDDEPASSSVPASALLATIVVLVLAGVLWLMLIRRRGRVEQGA